MALLALAVCMPLCTFAQITVSARKTSIRSVIQQIERTSEYRFFYNSSLPDLDRKVDIEVKDAAIGATLDNHEQLWLESNFRLTREDLLNKVSEINQKATA